jgi:hypothetical protein
VDPAVTTCQLAFDQSARGSWRIDAKCRRDGLAKTDFVGLVEAVHGRPERYRHEERQCRGTAAIERQCASPGDNQIHQQTSTDYSDQGQGRGDRQS